MIVKAGPYEFHDIEYDSDADILYLSVGTPEPSTGIDTPEGHTLCYAEDAPERVVGLDLFYPRRILSRDGAVSVTLPDVGCIQLEGVEEAVAARAP